MKPLQALLHKLVAVKSLGVALFDVSLGCCVFFWPVLQIFIEKFHGRSFFVLSRGAGKEAKARYPQIFRSCPEKDKTEKRSSIDQEVRCQGTVPHDLLRPGLLIFCVWLSAAFFWVLISKSRTAFIVVKLVKVNSHKSGFLPGLIEPNRNLDSPLNCDPGAVLRSRSSAKMCFILFFLIWQMTFFFWLRN